MAHWLDGVARRAGLPRAGELECPKGAGIEEAWARTCHVCGVEPQKLAEVVAAAFHTRVADLTRAEATSAKLLPESVARRFTVFPVGDRDRYLEVATADPVDAQAEDEIGFASGRTPRLLVAPPHLIREAIDATYSPDRVAENLLAMVEGSVGDLEVIFDKAPEGVSAEESATGPVVRLASIILHTAIAEGASDIHIQPTATGGVVRYRVDGVLRTAMQMPLNILTRVISRIKIMGHLDIADRIRPQDGRAKVVVGGVRYDLRISTVPARGAEKAVIRILDPEGSQTLDDTGMASGEVGRVRRLLAHRDGIFVVTGPTGSGKTSTLYAALREISTEDVNIMTVEDPVEYVLSGLTQIQVEPKQGVTFASALRAILRQDPDVIFIGEIRDEETAGIAAQASLTGHLVLATLHTNDAVGAIRRFLDLGLETHTLTETLRGVLAQRLVRRVCMACAVPATGPHTEEERAFIARYGVEPAMRAVGCEQCRRQGYSGRIPVTELMVMTPRLSRLISAGAEALDLHAQAVADGMRPLLESALDLVRKGVTTLQEQERVLGEDEEIQAAGEILPQAASAQDAPAGPMTGVPAAAGAPETQLAERDPGAVPHVLVVDDDGANRAIAKALLEKEGYRVTEAADGGEALVQLFQGLHFDLMVLDLDMPTLGGLDVLKTARRSVKTVGLPVVILTGSSDPEREIELMEAGADDYIRKPMEPRRFVLRIKATLRRAGA